MSPLDALNRAASSPLARQFIRFASIGGVSAIIHYGVLVALVELGGHGPVFSSAIGFVLAATFSYLMHRRFTFSEQPAFGLGAVKFAFTACIGLALNALLLGTFVHFGVNYLIAQAAAIGIVLFWNFTASRFFVFKA